MTQTVTSCKISLPHHFCCSIIFPIRAGFTASAFVWLATAYAVFAVFCWSAPAVMAVLGLKVVHLHDVCNEGEG